nr:hypothetical protein [Frankia sp. QA3]
MTETQHHTAHLRRRHLAFQLMDGGQHGSVLPRRSAQQGHVLGRRGEIATGGAATGRAHRRVAGGLGAGAEHGVGVVGEGDALRDHPPHAGLAGRRDEIAGSLDAQPVRQGEIARHVPRFERGRDRGEQVDQGVRRGVEHRAPQHGPVQRVGGDTRSPRPFQLRRAHRSRPGEPDDLMPASDQQRHQLAPDHPGRPATMTRMTVPPHQPTHAAVQQEERDGRSGCDTA